MITSEAAEVLNCYIYNIDDSDMGKCKLFDRFVSIVSSTINRINSEGQFIEINELEERIEVLDFWHKSFHAAAVAEIERTGDWYAGGRCLISEALFNIVNKLNSLKIEGK